MLEIYPDSEYQLPESYNGTEIILAARDPNWLYAYWEISEDKKKQFIDQFGMELWEKSIPSLKIINISKIEELFIRINESSNSWYINVEHPGCVYFAEIGRKISDTFFISLATSNCINTPGDNISANTTCFFVDYNYFRTKGLTLKPKEIYEQFDRSFRLSTLSGVSSPGVSEADFQETFNGVSSYTMFESKKQL